MTAENHSLPEDSGGYSLKLWKLQWRIFLCFFLASGGSWKYVVPLVCSHIISLPAPCPPSLLPGVSPQGFIQGYKSFDLVMCAQVTSVQHDLILNNSVQFSSVTQSCPTFCNPMDCSMPGLPVHHQLLEFIQTHVHQVGDAIQPSHPLSSPSPPAFNLSQHQGLFQWINSLHEVAKVLEFQLQYQSFQWTPRTDLL